MAISTTSQVPRGPVTAQLHFFQPPADGATPFTYVDDPPAGEPQFNYGTETHDVAITDARGREADFTLDEDGFQILQDVPPSAETGFVDDESIRKNYYPEVERLLLDHIPGSTRVFLFDHTIRRSRPGAERSPVLRVHIDQTAKSAAMRVRRHVDADADALLQGRYRVVNVWRPLNRGPVESWPLAFASSASLRDEDVTPVEHRYRTGYTGYTAGISHHPLQRWYYLSGMTGDERLLLECFDSESLKPASAVKGGRVAHTAFEDPRTRKDAEGRESIEVRALVFGP